ncbi:hypothetical protein CCAX7_001760 [Capsulimonas corticalis]|uniref:Uncharacterized protein n=1 Tax=Capsulimonas corticalis TaxID=2219043 RepID=A0A402CRI8_9BACT|nr:TlpA disulfide reductase family protein [Capsulimonas corticalis]BDI28125.1 hypothetical protein CCAX7_001760 [Capsulimonas corticalis]
MANDRRAAGALVILLCVAVPAHQASASPRIDPQALAVLREAAETARKARGVAADFVDVSCFTSGVREIHKGSLRYLKPHYWRIDGLRTEEGAHRRLQHGEVTVSASDGKSDWISDGGGRYMQFSSNPPISSEGREFQQASGFLDETQYVINRLHAQQRTGTFVSLVYAGKKNWDGASFPVIQWTHREIAGAAPDAANASHEGKIYRDEIYIGSDRLVHRVVTTTQGRTLYDFTIRRVKLDPMMSARDFAFSAPRGEKPQAPQEETSPVLPAGTAAPDFLATTPDGRAVHLSDYKGKPVILDFWATWCMPCQYALPYLQQVYDRVKDRGVACLAICVYDKKTEFAQWLQMHKTYTFASVYSPPGPGGSDPVASAYHLTSIPAQLVIDKDGKVSSSHVGYSDGYRLEAALANLGVDANAPESRR